MSIVRQITAELSSAYPQNEARAIAIALCGHVTGWSRAQLLSDNTQQLSDHQKQDLRTGIERIKNHEPLQYVTGETDFFGLPFKVDRRVLIPRPETEELVEWIIHDHKDKRCRSIVDLCTGSGCIAISLAKNIPEAQVSAYDISEDALLVATENAALNEVPVNFFAADVLSDRILSLLPDTDVIVSNPPYVLESEKASMHSNVMDFEPHIALFVDDADPLCFYKIIGELAIQKLYAGGSLYVEINRAKGQEVIGLFRNIGFGFVEMRKDLFGNARMVKAIKN